jgi:hypothetical protein
MSRDAAPSRRPSPSRGGWWPTSSARARLWQRCGARPIQPGSTWMQLSRLGKTTLAQVIWSGSAVRTHTLNLVVKDQG